MIPEPQSKVERDSIFFFLTAIGEQICQFHLLVPHNFLICHLHAVSFPRRAECSDNQLQLFVMSNRVQLTLVLTRVWKRQLAFSFTYHQSRFHFKGFMKGIITYWIVSLVGFHILRGGKWSHSLHYWLILRSKLQILHTEIYKIGPLLFSHYSLWTTE